MKRSTSLLPTGALASLMLAAASAQGAPPPVSNLQAADKPWDAATKVVLTWEAPADSDATEYVVYRALAEIGGQAVADPEYKVVEPVMANAGEPDEQRDGVLLFEYEAEVNPNVALGEARKEYGHKVDMAALETQGHSFRIGYLFQVEAMDATGARSARVSTTTPIVSSMEWFDLERFWLAMITIVFCGAVVYWINHARSGKPINVRKIAGLEAVDEAVGRATEMGRSCLFVPGIQDINEIQTIAGITILARVSKTAAEYDAKVEVPTSRALVMTTARETVQAAFLAAGRPDAYNEDLIYYVTDEQFGYVAYLQGMMVREKPAACFYMGAFFAESLILAETGNSIGAIQVAGTAMPAQLPFFVAACDYTLIGEEFFAASAYLSGSPEELGSLKGQDVGKILVAGFLIVGVALGTIGSIVAGPDAFEAAVEFIKNTMLT